MEVEKQRKQKNIPLTLLGVVLSYCIMSLGLRYFTMPYMAELMELLNYITFCLDFSIFSAIIQGVIFSLIICVLDDKRWTFFFFIQAVFIYGLVLAVLRLFVFTLVLQHFVPITPWYLYYGIGICTDLIVLIWFVREMLLKEN